MKYLLIFALIILFPIPIILAQTNDSASDIELYIPQHMIVGHDYHGMLIHSGHGDRPVLGILATNKDALTIPESVVIKPYEDHTIFEVKPLHAGLFSISVKVDGITIQKSVAISEESITSSLLLVLPEKTRASNLLGAVYLVDELSHPILASDVVTVSLLGSAGISLPDTVTISPGSTGATFSVDAFSSGNISASSGIMHDSVDIITEDENVMLVMDVYPKIMLENSFGYYFLWFEDDAGNPQIPPGVSVASLHSSNKEIARFDLRVGGSPTSEGSNTFSDGVTVGKIYTGKGGVASITSSIPGFGSAISDFIVGPAKLGTTSITTGMIVNKTFEGDVREYREERVVETVETVNLEPIDYSVVEPVIPTDVFFGIFPPKTAVESYVAAGLYRTVSDESINIGLDDVTTTKTSTEFYPLASMSSPISDDAIKLYITSNGAKHDSVAILDAEGIPTHVNIYDIGGTPGVYDVTVSSPQMDSQEAETVEFTGESPDKYHIEMLPLPALTGHILDLALIYIVDSEGRVVDPKEVFGSGITLHLESESIFLTNKFVNLNDPVGIIRGAYSDGTFNQITAFGAGLDRVEQKVGVSPTDSNSKVLIDIPPRVHSHEQFVAVAHLVKDGKAISYITDIIETGGGCLEDETGIFSCTSSGTLSIFSDVGSNDIKINPYLTSLPVSFQYTFKDTMSVGKVYLLTVNAPEDTVISVDTAIEHTIDENTITFTPDDTGEYEIIVAASSPGTRSELKTIPITVNDQIDVAFKAIDSSGTAIGVNVAVKGNGVDERFLTDETVSIPRTSITVNYPSDVKHGDSGYQLVDVELYDGTTNPIHRTNAVTFVPDHGYFVTATYERVVLIDVIGGTGSGVYGVGDTVVVSAPTKYTLAFLVREVLDSWDGIDSTSETITFRASEDLTLFPTYRTDYLGAVGVFALMAVLVIFVSFRGNHSYRLRVSQVKDLFSGLLKPLTSKKKGDKKDKKKKKKKKKGDDEPDDDNSTDIDDEPKEKLEDKPEDNTEIADSPYVSNNPIDDPDAPPASTVENVVEKSELPFALSEDEKKEP